MASNYPEYRRLSDVTPPLRTPEDDELSIIDVNAFDDTADEKWLYSAARRRNSVETNIEDLDAWLHADEPEQCDSTSRRSFDSRTFTRIKRRSNNRQSFDDINDEFPSEATPSTNMWKAQPILESPLPLLENSTQKERRESIPMMLRPKTNQALTTYLSESPSSIHSQASMDAFLNLAKSKEGISLLSETSDPDLGSFLMNVSQPSLLYSSIISDGRNDENAAAAAAAAGDSLIDSQILTDSMMEASMFKEVQDTTMLAEFLKQSGDDTMLVDRTFCKLSDTFDLHDKTFVNEPLPDEMCVDPKEQRFSDRTFSSGDNCHSNDTFTTFPSPAAAASVGTDEANSSEIVHENRLNSTRVISNSLNSTRSSSLNNSTASNYEIKTDLTFDVKSASPRSAARSDATFDTCSSSARNSQRDPVRNSALDRTFSAVPKLRAELLQQVQRSAGIKFDSTFTASPSPNIEPTLDLTYDRPNSASSSDGAEPLDATFVRASPSQQSESLQVANDMDVTYDAPQQISDSKLNSAYNVQRVSYANKNFGESLAQNRFNTYKKESKLVSSRLSKASQVSEGQRSKTSAAPLQPNVANAKTNNNLDPQRFNTYKKSSNAKNNNIDDNLTIENKLEATFVKPPEKLQSKLQAPRQLTRLPQLFQKSNPNLGSNLRPAGKFRLEAGLEGGFGIGSQPNIASNMNTLSRFKSEGRLLQMKSELVKDDSTSRSMESIDSSASARSAPDLDDRRSLCSDSSRVSYTIKPRNLETLKQLASMGGGGQLGGSTPKPKGHTILENTWVQELPSPILKNGKAVTRSASPSDSAEFAKTSSPLEISPVSSIRATEMLGAENDVEATKENIQAVDNVQTTQLRVRDLNSRRVSEQCSPVVMSSKQASPTTVPSTNATKLRRPTNWTGKVANGASSGIPRPASRIPAPKVSRPK